MKKKVLSLCGALMVIALAVVLFIPSSRYFVLGYASGEPFQDGRPISYWINTLQRGDAEARNLAAKEIGYLGPEGKQAVPALGAALKDKEELVRLNASLALLKMSPESQAAVPALGEALQDEIPTIRMNAIMALHRMGPEAREAVPALIKALQDRDNWKRQPVFFQSVARVAVSTLGRMGRDAKDARDTLANLLYDERSSEAMREEIGAALKKIDQDEAD